MLVKTFSLSNCLMKRNDLLKRHLEIIPLMRLKKTLSHIRKFGFIAEQAGFGKTIFTKLSVKEMLDLAIRLFDSENVFFLRFWDVDYDERTDLLLFLSASAKFVADMLSELRKMILRELQDCDSDYIVMDGLDEAIIDLKAQQPNCNAVLITTAEIFIKNLLTGNIFLRAEKLVT